ncbi:MAG: hypothetical protein KDJ26_06210 [Alphaproteobacteria bacterium]|jgi:hypothetical protein|nr:hypothetical protein [Alphaproteobacteria bacterium]MCB1551579.1 hypothetical protein [Alphaproteobacteria bacterium]MCB9984171.1 hypothetical protein [Micavibrio sp.]HPQ51051.1 hypothetical protein [Alphaproteobacteria bacterium]HRK97018.1 hypothetical protein [Alphaproteobacteria bacterium]
MKQYNPQNGSAIIYVFVGVILFAILAITFSRGMRQTTGDVDSKTAKVGATEIIEYAKAIDRSVNRMLLNQISEADIGFTNSTTTLSGTGAALYTGNPNCATATCQVFDPTGGKINPRPVSSSYVLDNATMGALNPMSGGIFPNVVIIDSLGTANPDLVLSFYGLKPAVCAAINDAFNIQNPSGLPPTEDATAAGDMFTGDFISATTVGDGVADLAGKTDFCYKFSGSSPTLYVYQHVLIIR